MSKLLSYVSCIFKVFINGLYQGSLANVTAHPVMDECCLLSAGVHSPPLRGAVLWPPCWESAGTLKFNIVAFCAFWICAH